MTNQQYICKGFSRRQKIYLGFKRILDILFSFFAIVLLSWLMLICAVLIKLTSCGPVIFKQQRYGRYGVPFTIYKFRSMRVDCKDINPTNMTQEQHDQMVTKWGHIMRKLSLDELPQLFNILKGDMSLIGPRPDIIEEEVVIVKSSFVPSPFAVRPGLTGRAQVAIQRQHNRAMKGNEDSCYVKTLSFKQDVKIFFLTFKVIFGGD